jgi:hypothetical protein
MAFLVLIIVANIANICDKIQEYAGIDNLSLNIILGRYGFGGIPDFLDLVCLGD